MSLNDDDDAPGDGPTSSDALEFLRQLMGAAAAPTRPATVQDILNGDEDGRACDCPACAWRHDMAKRVAQLIADTPPIPADTPATTPDEDKLRTTRGLLSAVIRQLAVQGEDGLLATHAFVSTFRLTTDLLEDAREAPEAPVRAVQITHPEGGRA